MKMLLIWGNNFKRYGLMHIQIFYFFIFGFLSAVSELIGLSIFIPIFKFIESNGISSQGNEDQFLLYIFNFYSSINISPTLETLLVTSFLMFVISKTIIFAARIYHINIFNHLLMSIRLYIFSEYINTSLEYKDDTTVGDVVNAIVTESKLLITGLLLPMKFMISIVSVLISLVALLLISYQMTLLTIILVTAIFFIPMRWVSATSHVSRQISNVNANLTSFVINRLNSSKLLKICGTEKMESYNFKKIALKNKVLLKSIQALKAKADYVLEPVLLGVSLFLIYVGSTYNSLSFEYIALFLLILIRIIPLVKEVMSQLQAMNRVIGPTETIGSLLDDIEDNQESSYGIYDLNHFSKNITFDSVDYNYPDNNKKALTNISFTIEKGCMIAIVGASGSGKSTLVDIMTRLRKSSKGVVRIDHRAIQDYTKNSLKKIVAYMPQQPIFFASTVKEHINYGKHKTIANETINSAKISGASTFINELHNTYESHIGSDHIKLSGGQKKRLDLARAINGNSEILILDEPSSGLDLESSRNLYKALADINKQTRITVVVVTHDLDFIRDFQKIIVLNNGSIQSIGKHKDLVSQEGWYKQTCND